MESKDVLRLAGDDRKPRYVTIRFEHYDKLLNKCVN